MATVTKCPEPLSGKRKRNSGPDLAPQNSWRFPPPVSEDELIRIYRCLSLRDIFAFIKASKQTLRLQSRLFQAVSRVEIRKGDSKVAQTLDFVARNCPNLRTLKVYKYFYKEREHYSKVAQVFERCRFVEGFIGWLNEEVLSLLQRDRYRVKKLFVDLSESPDVGAHLRKFPETRELIMRGRETAPLGEKNLLRVRQIGSLLPMLQRVSVRSILLDARTKASLSRLRGLSHFEIIGGGYGDADVRELCERMPRLKHLGLCGNNLSARAVRSIGENCRELRSLDIMVSNCDVCEESFGLLCSEEFFPLLSTLFVCKWSEEKKEEFSSLKPRCRLVDFEEWKAAFED